MIINEQQLKEDIASTIAQSLQCTSETAKRLITDEEMEEIIDLMFEAETEYINQTLDIFQKRLDHYTETVG